MNPIVEERRGDERKRLGFIYPFMSPSYAKPNKKRESVSNRLSFQGITYLQRGNSFQASQELFIVLKLLLEKVGRIGKSLPGILTPETILTAAEKQSHDKIEGFTAQCLMRNTHVW